MAIATAHFHKAFSSQDHYIEDNILNCIPQLITCDDNESLCVIPSESDIRDTVFSMSVDSAPGPDGFTGAFYQKAWPVITDVVCKATQEFFLDCHALPRCVTATLIALIPKRSNATNIADFRPISLCNFFYKIISTIMNNRLAAILPKIISPEQSAFVKER